jgi:hypothetical protein
METPVIQFYSPREVEANVKVAFPGGLITEWYPKADYEVYQTSDQNGALRRLATNLTGIDTSLRSVTGALEWRDIKLHPNSVAALPAESGPSHYYAARESDASPLSVGAERERFLFYRGVGRFAVPLWARLSVDGKIVVENAVRHRAQRHPVRESRRADRLSERRGDRRHRHARSAVAE